MSNGQKRRSRKLETPSAEKETRDTQVETPNPGEAALTISNVIVQESFGENNWETQLIEQIELLIE